MKKNNKKFGYGTSINNPITSISETLSKNDINWAKARYEATTDPQVMALSVLGEILTQYSSNTPIKSGNFGNINISEDTANNLNNIKPFLLNIPNLQSALTGFAFGGNVDNRNVEVEDKEVAELPTGEILKFFGSKHEQGGINVNLPKNTEIFSNRIKVGKETMAKRKQKRNKEEKNSLDRYLNNKNIATQNTYKRIKEINEIENEKDLNIQNIFNSLMQDLERPKFPYGTGPVPKRYGIQNRNSKLYHNLTINDIEEDANRVLTSLGYDLDLANPYSIAKLQRDLGITGDDVDGKFGNQTFTALKNYKTDKIEIPKVAKVPKSLDGTMMILRDALNKNQKNLYEELVNNLFPKEKEKEKESVDTSKITNNLGDTSVFLGDLVSTFGGLLNTLRNRATDTPNINPFENFGNDALTAMENALKYIDDLRGDQISDLNLERNSLVKRNRAGSQSVNTMKAFDTAADVQYNDALNKAYNPEVLAQIFSQIAQLENVQDQKVMQGEYIRDIADRQDKDIFHKNLGEDISSIGQGLQKIGKDINVKEYDKTLLELLNFMSPYIEVNQHGEFKLKDNIKIGK